MKSILSLAVGVTAVGWAVASEPVRVAGPTGYNCWPMISSTGDRLICLYTSGKIHDPGERGRGTFARMSKDGGVTWSDPVTVSQRPDGADTPVGKGRDESGAALFWVRRIGANPCMALYRTTDGEKFELVSETVTKPHAMQVTDVFRVPTVGLMSFWFGGWYDDRPDPRHWGTMTSADNGKTWKQSVCGEVRERRGWPTEPSGAYVGNGCIMALARMELGEKQFQMTSEDYGKTWKVMEVPFGYLGSTPSLLYDATTDALDLYEYQRGPGLMRHARVCARDVFASPERWPKPLVILRDGGNSCDAGNVNALRFQNRQYLTYYTGKFPDCSVMVWQVPLDVNMKGVKK